MTDSLYKRKQSSVQYSDICNGEGEESDVGNRCSVREELIANTHASSSPVQYRARAFSLHANRNSLRNSVKQKKRGNRSNSFVFNESVSSLETDVRSDSIAHCLFEAKQKGKMDNNNSDDNFRVRRARSFRERPERSGENLRRVRSFKTTSKGLVNRGDSFKSKKATDYVGCERETTENEHEHLQPEKSIRVIPRVTMTKSDDQTRYYRVLMLGAEGVGKSSIIDQFMTSEFLGSGCFNVSQSEDERKVTIQVDGEESTLEFLQSEDFEENVENLSLDGFLVVYSTTERGSFDWATEVLKQLRDEVGGNKAIILVGNKTDLVRKRTISADEGRNAADGYGCKYIETSAALNHRVDDLLVGVYKQIMLKFDSTSTTEEPSTQVTKLKPRKSSFKRTKRFLEKVFLGNGGKEKKTENLYVD